MPRRRFLKSLALGAGAALAAPVAGGLPASPRRVVRTVGGSVPAEQLGIALPHEHVLVDFVGAEAIRPGRYDPDAVFEAVLPHLQAARAQGVGALFECTPAYLGRDPQLLRRLSQASGLRIVANTGLYGAANDKFVPAFAYSESAEQLAEMWIKEAREGIGDTGIRPGFIKTAVDSDPQLSPIDRKLVVAAGLTHLDTGLAIGVHTAKGPGLEILDTLSEIGAPARSCIWIHAQHAPEEEMLEAARRGAWIELDGLREKTAEAHLERVLLLRDEGRLGQVLLSHDAGWFDVVNPERPFRDYSFLLDAFVPLLEKRGLSAAEIDQLLVRNPARAFGVPAQPGESVAAP